MQQQAHAVGMPGANPGRLPDEIGRAVGAIDHVMDEVSAFKAARRKQWIVSGLHADRGGVDDKVGLGKARRQMLVIKAACLQQDSFGGE